MTSHSKSPQALWLTNALQLLHTCLNKTKNKRRTCFYKNHFNPTSPLLLFIPHFVDILRTATDIILLRLPNFTDY